jgi:hypothetical protein
MLIELDQRAHAFSTAGIIQGQFALILQQSGRDPLAYVTGTASER